MLGIDQATQGLTASRDPLAHGFHGDKIYQTSILKAIGIVKPTLFIETGTYYGDSTRFVATSFGELPVLSCETELPYFRLARTALRPYKNVEVFNDTSPKFLRRTLSGLKGEDKLMFFLDAHWGHSWPLADELKIIASQTKGCVIVIDDFRSPKDCFHYDSYGGQALDLEYVHKQLSMTNRYDGFISNYGPDQIRAAPEGHDPLVGNLFLLQNLEVDWAKLATTEPFATHYIHLNSLELRAAEHEATATTGSR
jgi:predicted O-methyltransferase YrrM